MKSDKGTLFLAFTGLLLIVLIIALAAAVVTCPSQPSSTADSDQGPPLGTTDSQQEFASPIMKDPNYPGISTKYAMDGFSKIG
ncbi:MAG TPA: hypothetical protein VGJ92_09385, partial [Methanocella sp.]